MAFPPVIGGPIDGALPPDPSHLLALLQRPTTEPRDGLLVVRGQARGLLVKGGFWATDPEGAIRIDAALVDKLRGEGVYSDRLWVVIDGERFELRPREVAGVLWATIGGPVDPDPPDGQP